MASNAETVVASTPTDGERFQPVTELGRKLWEIRQQIEASGEPLLSLEELEREIAERRGGLPPTER